MNNSKDLFLYNDGIKELAQVVLGKENIHMGIRPFGFHAGNMTSLYIYPYLFCEEVERLGKEVSFTFFISINDYEQDALGGPDYQKYPFNVYPQNTTLGYLKSECDCHEYSIDHWLPIIKGSILKLKDRFPGLQMFFIKNSELKNDLKFKEILTSTIKNPSEQADIYKRLTDKEILDTPVQYAGAVCPFCKLARGETKIDKVNGDYIFWKCNNCKVSLNQPYTHFDYWFYHKPLFTARMSIFNIDITFSGNDHFDEGDYAVRKEFMKRFSPEIKIPKMFFAPLVLTENGKRMSKTQKNAKMGIPKSVLEACRNSNGGSVTLSSNMFLESDSGLDYFKYF